MHRRSRGRCAGCFGGLVLPRQQRHVNDVLFDLAADGPDRAIDVAEPELVRRQQMEGEALRRELLDRKLDRTVAMTASALDRDRLLRQLLDREVREGGELSLHEQRAGAT